MGIIRVVHVPGKEKEADFLTKTNITEMKFKQVAHTVVKRREVSEKNSFFHVVNM